MIFTACVAPSFFTSHAGSSEKTYRVLLQISSKFYPELQFAAVHFINKYIIVNLRYVEGFRNLSSKCGAG